MVVVGDRPCVVHPAGGDYLTGVLAADRIIAKPTEALSLLKQASARKRV